MKMLSGVKYINRRVYVVGPYYSDDIERMKENILVAESAGRFLAYHGIPVYVPQQATAFWNHDAKTPFYLMDLHHTVLSLWSTDALILPSWKDDFFSRRDHTNSKRLNKKLWYHIDDLISDCIQKGGKA